MNLNAPWAIAPEKLLAIRDLHLSYMRGELRDLDAIAAKLGPTEEPASNAYQVTPEGVAIIAIDGVLAKRMNVLLRIFGGTSSQLIQRDLKNALANPSVRGILLAIDSPGGTVDGTQELAQTVHEGATQKPIAAWSDGLIGSAAYWIGSAAPRVFISGDVVQAGSIGVVATHVDVSKAEASRGIKVTEIVAGRYKRIASQHAPLSDEGQRALQEQVV
jgi:signal peptide peptidase SppA